MKICSSTFVVAKVRQGEVVCELRADSVIYHRKLGPDHAGFHRRRGTDKDQKG